MTLISFCFNIIILPYLSVYSHDELHLLKLQKLGANGFILKESPELSVNDTYSKETLISLKEQAEDCLSDSFLKEIWSLSYKIKSTLRKNIFQKYFPGLIKDQLNGIKYQTLLLTELDAMYDLLQVRNENRFNHSMMSLYKIIECLNEIFFPAPPFDTFTSFYDKTELQFYNKNSCNWMKLNEEISYYDKDKGKQSTRKIHFNQVNSTLNKILNLAVHKLNLSKNQIEPTLTELSTCRNSFIHPDVSKRNNLRKITFQDIVTWLKTINEIIIKL